MDDNVMKTYTTVASQPKHFVQYDQGEDRWLCTLLLKQGWRVEYSAACDSFTACPEGFKEFYNQRRRWMPSTMLNIMDLIKDYRRVVKNNPDISYLYIVYQFWMMFGSVVGPGSIFLMLIGAFNIAFGLSNTNALILNAVLVIAYIWSCLFLKTDYQIRFAELLTVLYALIMCAVYVGIFITIIDDGPWSITGIAFFITHGSFVLAALLHPQEFNCIWCLVVYILTIPSMYLLLTIYSVFNMNNVSWGTREAPKTEEEKAAENAEKAEAAKKKGKVGGIQDWARRFGSFSNFLSCACCTADDSSDKLMVMEEKLDKKLNSIEEKLEQVLGDKTLLTLRQKSVGPGGLQTQQSRQVGRRAKTGASKSWTGAGHRGVDHPYWMEKNIENLERCKVLADAPLGQPLEDKEDKFWKDLIANYLRPYSQIENKETKERVSKELLELRNKMAFGFVMLNIIWITLIYMLQVRFKSYSII